MIPHLHFHKQDTQSNIFMYLELCSSIHALPVSTNSFQLLNCCIFHYLSLSWWAVTVNQNHELKKVKTPSEFGLILLFWAFIEQTVPLRCIWL